MGVFFACSGEEPSHCESSWKKSVLKERDFKFLKQMKRCKFLEADEEEIGEGEEEFCCCWFANWKFGDGRDRQRSISVSVLLGRRLRENIFFSLVFFSPPGWFVLGGGSLR